MVKEGRMKATLTVSLLLLFFVFGLFKHARSEAFTDTQLYSQRRYFTLVKGSLSYFESEALSKRLGTFTLNANTCINFENTPDGHMITLVHETVRQINPKQEKISFAQF